VVDWVHPESARLIVHRGAAGSDELRALVKPAAPSLNFNSQTAAGSDELLALVKPFLQLRR
jgi:hypothetical protein